MLLTNCRLIPELCEGITTDFADIRIEDGNIVDIQPAGGDHVGEEVIDCAGKTVMPGLFDLHVHPWMGYVPTPENVMLPHGIHKIQNLLRYGYTSIREVGSAYQIGIRLRDLINAGKMVGPHMISSGMVLTPNYFHMVPVSSSGYGRAVSGPYSARDEVRRSLAETADFIKILAGGIDPGMPVNRPHGNKPIFFPDEMEEIEKTTKWEQTYFIAHTVSTEGNTDAIHYHARSVEHGCWWTKENTDQLIAEGYQSAITPTTWVFAGSGYYPADAGFDIIKGLRDPYDEGKILMGFGTDMFEEWFMIDPAEEFLTREVKLGFTRIDILKQATINSAKIYGSDAVCGTVKVGKRADLIVVDGKPDEDLNVFHNPPAYVLKSGEVVARDGMIKL